MANTCIRVLADINQINNCKCRLTELSNSFEKLSKALSLTGNEVRLKILFLLNEEGELCPCDLSDILNMTVPAISQHIRKLKDGNIIIARKTGQTIFYRINQEFDSLLIPLFEKINSPNQKVQSI
jgi:DNA-binding transcriptional ArsR family regulator